MTWKPAAQEPTDLDLCLIDAIRAAALPAGAIGSVRLDHDGVLIVDRPGSAQVRMVLQVIEETNIRLGERSARRIRYTGRAVVDDQSLVLSATAILDRVTGAFLDVDFEIVSRAHRR